MALRHEEARVARYGRPAAVMAIRLLTVGSGVIDRYAARIGGAIRHEARETDRVARVAPDRFHVLLPETHSDEAGALAERVRAACVAVLPGVRDADVEIQVAAACTSGGGTLAQALRTIQTRLEA